MLNVNGRDRVITSLEHKVPDRVPLDIGGCNNTTMHVKVENALKVELNLQDNGTVIRHFADGIVVPDESILQYFGSDTRCIYIDEIKPWIYDEESNVYYDQWNIGYKKSPNGYFFDFYSNPLKNIDEVEKLENLTFFEPNKAMMVGLTDRIAHYKGEYCLILEGFREQFLGIPSWLRGNENFYIDLVSDDGLAEMLLDILEAHYFKWVDFVLESISGIDIVKFADDLGTQNSLIISPATYRKHIKPRQERLFRHVKEKTGCKLLFHSCGAIRPLIGDFIEIGIDAINPVQISASNMDAESLKKEFGNKIAFWGGGIDTQSTLEFGTPKQIWSEVRENIKKMKGDGGFVFAQVHNIMPDVPVENVLAMYDAYHEFAM